MNTINDIVLIYYEDQPFSFARIEDITADHKKDWYHVKLLLLQLPLETVTWILKDVYINGEEFTMGGKRMRFEKVVAPKDVSDGETKKKKESDPTGQKPKSATIVSLADRKPKT
jgi:hypothetical protein